MAARLLLLLLLMLLLAAAAVPVLAALGNQFYKEVPPQYSRQFEAGDKFSTIVRFVRDAELNASRGLGCPGLPGRRRFPLSAFTRQPASKQQRLQYSGFESGQRAALSMANLMNYIYQLAGKSFKEWFSRTDSHSYSYQAFWYSVVSSVVASDARIFGCYVVLFDSSGSIVKDFLPHAYRNSSNQLTVDNYSHEVFVNPAEPGFEWYAYHNSSHQLLVAQVSARPSQRVSGDAEKKISAFTSGFLRSPPPDSGEGVKVVTDGEGYWTPPVFVCSARKWLLSYAVPFLSGSSSTLAIKGWIVLEFNLRHLDVNQCNNDSTFASFYATDVCNQATTECVHIPGRGFTDTSFRCKCKRFFHFGNFTGDEVRSQYLLKVDGEASNYSSLECGPCPARCPASCTKDGWCLIEYDLDTLRALPLVIQTFCITVCVLVAGIVFKTRRSRVIKSSVWLLLEIFILGVSLLYITVFLMYVRPSYGICFIIPWLREIGFTITYGTMLMKVYRILCSFQSRKAHRVHVRDRDLLKYLAGILSVAAGFMAAWTAATVDHGRRLRSTLSELNCSSTAYGGQLVLEDGQVAHSQLGFRTCAVGYWDAVCAVGEMAFLVVGLFYCYCVRSAPCDFSEVRCITAAYCCELVFSLCYHVARHFVWNSVHPDYVYLMYFARCHLTVTITAALVLGPKLWYVHSPPKNSLNTRGTMYSHVDPHLGEAMGAMSLPNNGDVDALDINLTDMSPEDIRAELKRLYTQLQIFKTKVMRRENPHISKRKGGKKQTHRRFSLQPFYHKHSHKQPAASVQEEEASKVSEDSSNSAEGQEQQERPTGKESTATSSSSSSK